MHIHEFHSMIMNKIQWHVPLIQTSCCSIKCIYYHKTVVWVLSIHISVIHPLLCSQNKSLNIFVHLFVLCLHKIIAWTQLTFYSSISFFRRPRGTVKLLAFCDNIDWTSYRM